MAISWHRTVAGQAPWSSAASAVTNQTSSNFTLDASGYSSGFVRSETRLYSSQYSTIFAGVESYTYIEKFRSYSAGAFDGMAGTSSYSQSRKAEQTIRYKSTGPIYVDSASTSSVFSTNRSHGGSTFRESRYTTIISPFYTLVSSSTTTGVATGAYTSTTSAAPATLGAVVTTTQETTRSVISRHSVSSLSSTESASQTYTETISSYDTRATTEVAYVTDSYITGANHIQAVWRADQNEYFRHVTAIAPALTGLTDVLGPTVNQLTVSAAAGQISYGAAVGALFSTFTSNLGADDVSTTLTTTTLTYAPITVGASDGWIGGTATSQEYASGIFTSTAVSILPLQLSTVTVTVTARLTYSTKSVVTLSYVFSDTITGLNSTGGSAVHSVEHIAMTVTTFDATLTANGDAGSASYAHFGYSATLFTSPLKPFAGGTPTANMSRLERAFGFQHASSIGPGGGRGGSISANSSFFIGTDNYVMGDPNFVIVPAPVISTASTSNSSFSFSQGASQWDVTALRTDTSSSTLITFTASVGTAGASEFFKNCSAYAWSFGESATILGGPNALAGVPQKVSFGGLAAAGWKYTLQDSLGTTAYTTHLEAYTTANIGTSMIALESFSAAPAHGLAGFGPISFMTLPFNQ